MKIHQTIVTFQPISITLETEDEAGRFIFVVDNYLSKNRHCMSEKTENLFVDIANAFSSDIRFK